MDKTGGKKYKYGAWQKKLMILLFFCCAFLPVLKLQAKEQEEQRYETVEKLADSRTGALLPEAKEPSLMPAMADASWSHYSQLTDFEKEIYDAMAGVKGRDWFSVTSSNPLKITFSSPQAREKAYKASVRAENAFLLDYNEYYWISGFNISYYDINSKVNEISVYPVYYYEGVIGESDMTDAALQRAYDAVKGANRYELVKNAHDYIANLITYEPRYMDSSYTGYLPYCHTITGGLLDKYQHRSACECYSKLMRLICEKNNIPCILVSGGSTVSNGEVIADHMWNYVQMEDGLWYLVDITWDDQEFFGYTKTYDTYLLAGSENIGYRGTKIANDHIPVGTYSSSVSYTPFIMPTLSARSYLENHPDVEQAIKPSGISLDKTSLTLSCGASAKLTASLLPENAGSGGLIYYSSNLNVAAVTQTDKAAVVEGLKAGTATVWVRDLSGSASASCSVTVAHSPGDWQLVNGSSASAVKYVQKCTGCGSVLRNKIYSVALNASSLLLQRGKSSTALTIARLTDGDTVASWSSSAPAVVSVNKSTGKLTAKKTGTAVITVQMNSGARATCQVTVQKGTVRTKKLAFSKTAITLKKGQTKKLKVIRTPVSASDKLTFRSSNQKVVSVNANGKVQAKKKGKAVITVKSASGKKAKIKITVK